MVVLLDAQQRYREMMRDLVVPALRGMGLSGPARLLRCVNGSYTAMLWVEKHRRNTKQSVDFWIFLAASYGPPDHEEAWYWKWQLGWLLESNRGGWFLEAGDPVEPVADSVVAAVRDHGLPAMLAAIGSPGFPPDPGKRWARTFPAPEGPPPEGGGPPSALLRDQSDVEQLFTYLACADPVSRMVGVGHVDEKAAEDGRVLPALLDRLEHDLDSEVRRMAAMQMQWWLGLDQVRGALEATAAEDENLKVRWAARYMLRLADLQGSLRPG